MKHSRIILSTAFIFLSVCIVQHAIQHSKVHAASTPTPTTSQSEYIPPVWPAWWTSIPDDLRNFLELLHMTVYYFQRTSNLSYLLDGILPDAPTPTTYPPSSTPMPPTPTPTATPHNPSGETMPVGDIPGWHQIFTDDFSINVPVGSFPGSVYSPKWYAYPETWHDTSGNGNYNPTKVLSVNNGILNFYIHTENGIHLVSAPVPKIKNGIKYYGQGLLYGRYVIRFRSDPIPGYKTAWLLWPDSEVWPRDGEIDFPEGNLDATIKAFMHRQNGTSGSDQDAYSTNVTYANWHTAVTEWTATSVRFILDGQVVGTSTSRIPNTPMHWVIQTETNLDGYEPSDSAAGNVQVDWVAVYEPA